MQIDWLVLFFFGLAAFVFAFYRPRAAILLPLIFHSAYLVRSSFVSIPTTGLEVLLLTTTIPVLFGGRKEIVGFLNNHKIFVLLTSVFVLAATISAFIAPHPHTAWGFWKALIIEPIIYAVVLVSVTKDKNKIIYSLLAGALLAAILSLANVDLGEGFGRLRGIYDVSNSLALVVAPAFVLSLVMALTENKKVFWFISIILGIVLLATQSLAGLFSAAISSVLAFSLLRPKKFLPVFVIVFMILAGLFWQINSGKLGYLLNTSSSWEARKQIWEVSVSLVGKHPFFGTGLGTFEPAYQSEMKNILDSGGKIGSTDKPLEWVVRDPHNIFLSFWLNTGLLGLLSMTTLIVIGFRKSSSLAVALAFASLLIFGLADVPYWKNDLALIWWVFLLLSCGQRADFKINKLRANGADNYPGNQSQNQANY